MAHTPTASPYQGINGHSVGSYTNLDFLTTNDTANLIWDGY